jgi:hypothetical protein
MARLLACLALCCACAPAQTPPAAALIRGVLLERDTQGTGEFSVRAADNVVLRYQFDRKTYVERDKQMIDVPRLDPGDKVEVISDAVPGSVVRYARTVHVIPEAPPPRPQSAGRYRASRSLPERLPTGNLTYSGVVSRINSERIVLQLRAGVQQTLLLRKDTRFLQNGETVDVNAVKPNMRVFIRAGKDVYDEIEAYQVIWGAILAPE